MKLAFVAVLLAAIGIRGSAQDTRTVLLVIDDLHVDFRDTPRLRTTIKTFAAQTVRPGDRIAVVSTGTSSVDMNPATLDELQTISNRITGGGLKPDDLVGPTANLVIQYRGAEKTATSLVDAITRAASSVNGPLVVYLVSFGYPEEVAPGQSARIIDTARKARAPIFTIEPPLILPQPPELEQYRQASRRMLRDLADATGGTASR